MPKLRIYASDYRLVSATTTGHSNEHRICVFREKNLQCSVMKFIGGFHMFDTLLREFYHKSADGNARCKQLGCKTESVIGQSEYVIKLGKLSQR